MLALAAALALVAVAGPAPAPRPGSAASPLPRVVASYAHDLSTPNGLVPLTWPSITLDRSRSESFVVAEGFVRIFNAAGMEVHRFGDDGSLGYVNRVAVLDDGGIIAMASRNGKTVLLKCDFRGELVAQMALSGVPDAFADLDPDQLVYRSGRLYLAERGKMRVVVTDESGAYRQAFSLRQLVAAAVSADSDVKPGSSMEGFGVDGTGNLLFTMSTMFAAAIVSPSGELRIFGTRGSMPGRFNNVGGIDADEDGNIYVTDRLRSVVSVWNRDLKNLGEFGYRGYGTSNLITPYEIAVGNGRVFVAQAARRGVRVFHVQFQAPEPPPQAAGGKAPLGRPGSFSTARPR
jgi:hypothetical protein